MAAPRNCFPGKPYVSTWVLVLVCWIGPVFTSAGQSGVIDLEARDAGTAIEVSWKSGSITLVEPYLHYEFQMQKSTDMENWENVGDLIPGGVTTTASEPHIIQLPEISDAEFYRLVYRLNLPGGDLSGLDFSGADLRGANLSGTNLTGTDLSHADLRGANLTKANLENLRLAYAIFGETEGVPYLTEIAGEEAQPAALYLPLIPFSPAQEDYLFDPDDPSIIPSPTRHLLVMLESEATVGALNTLLAKFGATIEGSSPGDEILPNGLLTLGAGTGDFEDLVEVAERLNTEEIVLAAAPEMMMGLTSVTKDDNGTSAALPTDQNPEEGENVVAGLTSPVGGSLVWKWDEAEVHDGGNWGLELTRVPEMWNLKEAVEKNQNASIKIGVIDGGFPGHVDVPIRPATAEDRSGLNPSHGLHVAGIIGATHDNNLGIDGVTPFADMTGFTSSTVSFYTNGMNGDRFFKDVRRVLSTVSGVRIINLSQGFNWSKQQPWSQFRAPQVSSAMGLIFAELAANNPNVLIVCTAGNDGQEFPAL